MTLPCSVQEETPQPSLVVRARTTVNDLPRLVGESYGRITGYLAELGETPSGPPFAAYHNADMQDLEVEIGFPVSKPLPGKEGIQPGSDPRRSNGALCLHRALSDHRRRVPTAPDVDRDPGLPGARRVVRDVPQRSGDNPTAGSANAHPDAAEVAVFSCPLPVHNLCRPLAEAASPPRCTPLAWARRPRRARASGCEERICGRRAAPRRAVEGRLRTCSSTSWRASTSLSPPLRSRRLGAPKRVHRPGGPGLRGPTGCPSGRATA